MGIRCTTVAPETTISGLKKGTKRRRHFSSIFLGKGQFLFQQQPKEGN